MVRPSRSPTAIHLSCSVCHQTFGRQEHLTRHSRIHTHEKPYGCPYCRKRFSRLDVLTRHKASHEQPNDVSATPLSSRACKQCALDRVRCSRTVPCKRCSDRDLPCCYPAEGKVAPRSTTGGRRDLQSDEAVVSDTALIGISEAPLPDEHEGQIVRPSIDNTLTALNPADLNNAIGATSIWGEPPSDFANICDVDLGFLGINWISPGYQYDMDWQNDGTANHEADNFQEQTSHTSVTSAQPTSDGVRQQAHQATPSSITAQCHDSARETFTPCSPGDEYYVNRDGPRAPFGGRYHSRGSISNISTVPNIRTTSAEAAYSSNASDLYPRETYDNLVQDSVHEIQLEGSAIGIPQFPSHAQMDLYVQQYFDKFHPIFPFLRLVTFREDASKEGMLLLAVAAIGSRFVPTSQDSYEILSRTLDAALDRRKRGESNDMNCNDLYMRHAKTDTTSDVLALQAGILQLVCLMLSGKQGSLDRALTLRHHLVRVCDSLQLLDQGLEDQNGGQPFGAYTESDRWFISERRVRTGMVLWCLDSTMMYEFGVRPLMSLSDVKARLPSCEDAWDDKMSDRQANRTQSTMTLLEALETLYMEKRFPAELTEFSVGILIHAICRHSKDMMSASRLRSWIPSATAEHRSIPQLSTASTSWLPLTQTASKWRNSACDSLDILHWHANSKAAKSSGFEHHTILHLHLARIILLTPLDCIRTLSGRLTRIPQNSFDKADQAYLSAARNQLLQWVVRDRYKARLAVIHCAALYWHVRRYSCDSVQEPYAIYIATLVLWAFCIAMQLPEATQGIVADGEDDPDPSFCHLDRPLDDELVQLFVRVGHRMCPNVSKVGNILDSQAAPKVLREGYCLLTAGSLACVNTSNAPPHFTWGIEKSHADSLHSILEAMSHSETDVANQDDSIFPWSLI